MSALRCPSCKKRTLEQAFSLDALTCLTCFTFYDLVEVKDIEPRKPWKSKPLSAEREQDLLASIAEDVAKLRQGGVN